MPESSENYNINDKIEVNDEIYIEFFDKSIRTKNFLPNKIYYCVSIETGNRVEISTLEVKDGNYLLKSPVNVICHNIGIKFNLDIDFEAPDFNLIFDNNTVADQYAAFLTDSLKKLNVCQNGQNAES